MLCMPEISCSRDDKALDFVNQDSKLVSIERPFRVQAVDRFDFAHVGLISSYVDPGATQFKAVDIVDDCG